MAKYIRKNRRYRRRRKYYKRRTNKKFVKAVRRVIEKTIEKKYLHNKSNSSVSSSGYALWPDIVPQGTTDITRVGDQVTIRSLRFKIMCTVNVTSAINWVRCLIFQYFPAFDSSSITATTYPLNNILLDAVTYPYLSPYSHDNRYNFRILYDKTRLLDTVNVPVVMFKGIIKKFARRKIQYYSASSTNCVNGLTVLLISDQTTNLPTFVYSLKFNYSDA